jgi:hypothetical protein
MPQRSKKKGPGDIDGSSQLPGAFLLPAFANSSQYNRGIHPVYSYRDGQELGISGSIEMITPPLLMTSVQASEFLGVGQDTFRQMGRDPDLGLTPVTRRGCSRRWWRRAELERLAIGDLIEESA